MDLQPRGRRRLVARADLQAPIATTARNLLGALLVRREDDGTDTVIRLVEVEAYQRTDPASHTYRGPTPANATMFGPPGHGYVYFTYGMHHCLNVTGGRPGTAAAVLLRAGVVLQGHDLVRARRPSARAERLLAAGPARLTVALAVDRSWDGVDLCRRGSPLRLMRDDVEIDDGDVRTGSRVGVRQAADQPWRWWIADVEAVSSYRRHPRAGPPGSA